MKKKVSIMSIELSHDELLVLHEFLHRLENTKGIENLFEDLAEQEVLWHIQAQLEKKLVEPFRADYPTVMEAACRAVREQY